MEENLRHSIIPSKACSLLTTINHSIVKDTLKYTVFQGNKCEWDAGKACTEKENNICKICESKRILIFFLEQWVPWR